MDKHRRTLSRLLCYQDMIFYSITKCITINELKKEIDVETSVRKRCPIKALHGKRLV